MKRFTVRFCKQVITGALIGSSAVTALAQAPEKPKDLDSLLDRTRNVLEGVDKAEPAAETAAAPEAVDLDANRCASLALANNPRMGIADEKIAQQEAIAASARSARAPQVKANAAVTHLTGLETDMYGQRLASILLSLDSISGDKTNLVTNIGVEQVLYSGGQISAAIRAADALLKSEEHRREVESLLLAFEAKQAYYDTMAAEGLVQVAQDSVAAYTRHLTDAKQRLDQGMASKFEVLRAETELRARESDLESAEKAYQLSRLNLLRLINLPSETPVHLTGDIPWDAMEIPVENLVKQAQAQRPESAALDAAIDAAQADVSGKRGAFLPSAAASAKYQQVEGGGKVMPDGWTLSVGAEWNLYAGGKRKHDLEAARARVRELELQRKDVQRLIELDVQQAYTRVVEAIALIRKEKAARSLAEEGLSLAELRFQQGAGIQADTLDAVLALTSAKTALVKALRDYAVSLAALDRAVGKPVAAPAEK